MAAVSYCPALAACIVHRGSCFREDRSARCGACDAILLQIHAVINQSSAMANKFAAI